MKDLRTVLIDDEPDSVALMKLYLSKNFSNINIVGAFTSSVEALEKIPLLKPNLVFTDIEMPVMNGFELLSKLGDVTFNVVFVTAYNEFALQAFKFNALDYLVKPVNIDELKQVIEKAEKRLLTNATQLNMAAEQLRKGIITKIAVPSHNGISFIDLNDIVLVEASSNYSFLKLADGRKMTISKTLKDVQDVLELQHFLRIHRQYIINLNHVKFFNRNEGELTMVTGDILPVSRTHKDKFIERFGIL